MVKKIKVLTAIGNENLNDALKKEKEIEVLQNDIFYKEGVIEFLEKNYNDSAEENKLNEYQGIIDELVWFAVGYLRKSSFYNYIVSYKSKKYIY